MIERERLVEQASSTELDEGRLNALIPGILRSVDVALESTFSREIQSADGRTLLDIIRGLLFWSIRRMEAGGDLYASRSEALAKLVELPAKGIAIDTSAASLERLIASEAQFYEALDPESISDPATAYLGGKSMGRPSFAAAEPKLDRDTIRAYLNERFPQFPDLSVDDVTMLTGGLSKDTILFELTGAGELDGGIVLRKDFVQKGSDLSSIDEYPLLEAVYKAGLPVAEPMWAEPDTSHLGAAFIAVRRVPGHAAVSEGFSDPAVRRHFVERLAHTLARIHALSPVGIGIYGERATWSLTDLIKQQVENWADFWRRSQIESDVAMDFLLQWMWENVPPEPVHRSSVVHGDYGFHNLLTLNGEVTAILDWEFSHLGDPLEDVAYARQFVEPLGLWSEFLDDYVRYGGVPYDEARGHYFTIWQNVRNACLCAGALNAFSRGKPGHLRMGAAGISIFPRFKLAALRQIAELAAKKIPA